MSIRRRALEALVDITDHGAYAHLRLKQAVAGLCPRDAAWLSALVYETLDHMITIDYRLKEVTHGRQKPVIRGILRMGACQVLFMRVPARAACNESVQLAKEMGKGAMSGYVNAVLRALASKQDAPIAMPIDPVERLSVQYSWPQWLVRQWVEAFGIEETQALLNCKLHGMRLRAQWPFSTNALIDALNMRGASFTRGALDPNCIRLEHGFDVTADPLFQNGSMTVQSESAMLVCRACGVAAGMRVLDACAAPGGKSAYLWSLAEGNIDLTAFEVHAHRKHLLDQTLRRLHVNAHTLQRDAAVFDQRYARSFDVVLVDAPCSGLGVAGTKPDVRYQKNEEGLVSLLSLQERILDACAHYVQVGGVLVYATCTITKRENEEQVRTFLQTHSAYQLDDLTPFLPTQLDGGKNGMVQLLPHRHATEGFFIARLRRMY